MGRANWPDYAGLRLWSKNRKTGHFVAVYDGEAQGLDTEGGRWSTVCDEHGAVLSHETLAQAKAHAPDAWDWCSACQAEVAREPGCTCPVEDDGLGYQVQTHLTGCKREAQ